MMRIKNRSGMTLLELLIVLGILGILALTVYPAIINVLRVRSLETQAREILMDLNRAKMMAVKNKTDVRLIFTLAADGSWTYVLEEDAGSGFSIPGGILRKGISTEFQVAINLPDQNVEYSPLGLVQNYDSGKNTIVLSSSKLKELNKPDVRSLLVFGGGSVQYTKSSS